MGPAAELCGEIAHPYYADRLSVLLAEQGHGAGLLRILQAHDSSVTTGSRASAIFVLTISSTCRDLLRSHGGEMGKVKAETVPVTKEPACST